MKERARTIWMGNGFGIEFVVGDPWTIDILLVLEKDPTMSSSVNKTISSTSILRKYDEDGQLYTTANGPDSAFEPLRAFAERTRLEALEWAEIEIAEYKETEDLATIMGLVLDTSE